MDVTANYLGNNKSTVYHNSIKHLIQFIHNLEEKLSSIKTIHDKLHELISVVSKTHETIVDELTRMKTVLNEVTNEEKQDEDEVIPIDATKSEWDEEDDDDDNDDIVDHDDNDIKQIPQSGITKEFESKSATNLSIKDQQMTTPSSRRTDRLSLYSATSFSSSSTNSSTIENRPNSSTSKRSSNLKRSEQSVTRAKSPKSVSFNFDEIKDSKILNDENQQSRNYQPIEISSTEINNTIEEMTTSIIPTVNEILKTNSDLIPDLFKQHHNEITTKPNIGFKLGNALTNVRIHEIESINGDYLRLLNISNSDDYDLTGHFVQQNIACVPVCRFRFPSNTIIRAGQTITIWCGTSKDIEPQFPHVFVWKEQRRWITGPECVTILAKPNGQAIAWARSSHRVNTDQSSSDILFVHSKSNLGMSDLTSVSSSSLKNRSRLSAFNFIGNNKPPFAHSPNSPIHPDHHGGILNLQNDLRSPIRQRGGLSQLLNRPKSSPFASHIGCKQDLISMRFLRAPQTIQQHKQASVKT